jgi:beta-glucosidase
MQAAPWPARFLWGASTSAFQVEGATEAEGRGASIWDAWARQPGRMRDGESGEPAAGHHARMAEDVGWLARLGANAYRFSIAWPRVQPQGSGAANEQGLAFYDRLTDALLEAGIEPIACLYHWDLPLALQEAGGWPARDTAWRFADYAALMAARLADRIRFWASFNEPNLFTLFGHLTGGHPPGLADRAAYLRAAHHVNLAHGLAGRAIRGQRADALIGGIHNVQPVRPATPADADAARMMDALWNRLMPDAQLLARWPDEMAAEFGAVAQPGDAALMRGPADWFGLNHYSPLYVRADATAAFGCRFADAPDDGTPASGIGWRIEPEAFAAAIREVYARYRLPVIVTENGYGAEEDGTGLHDEARMRYIAQHVAAMRAALESGADVRGYLVWSLLDNLEWSSGTRVRFGLLRVEPGTLERRPKSSFHAFARLIRTGR